MGIYGVGYIVVGQGDREGMGVAKNAHPFIVIE